VGVDRLIPARWPNRRRCVLGGAIAAACAAALAVPAPDAISVILLGLLGVGLGIYTPANNAEIMGSVPAREAAAAGGMVNMTRGIGTALGVAVVSLGLHAGTSLGQPDAGRAVSMAALAAVALVGVWCGHRGGRSGRRGRAAQGLAAQGLAAQVRAAHVSSTHVSSSHVSSAQAPVAGGPR
jgi:Major Facilitator Superfamily